MGPFLTSITHNGLLSTLNVFLAHSTGSHFDNEVEHKIAYQYIPFQIKNQNFIG